MIEGAYGQRSDAREYLEKFYHLRLTLPTDRINPKATRRAYIDHLWKVLEAELPDPRYDVLIREHLTDLATIHQLPLRTIERIVTTVILVRAAGGVRSNFVAPIVAGLCLMRVRAHHLFEKARAGTLSYEEAAQYLYQIGTQQAGKPSDFSKLSSLVKRPEWVLNWWRFATSGEMSREEEYQISQGTHIRREDLLPLMAAYMGDLSGAAEAED